MSITKILQELASKISYQMNEISQLRQLDAKVAIEEINKAIAHAQAEIMKCVMSEEEIKEIIIGWHLKYQEDDSSKDLEESEQFNKLAKAIREEMINHLTRGKG